MMLFAVKVTKGPSTSVMVDSKEELVMMKAVYLKSQNKSKRNLWVILNLMHPNQSTLICIYHTSKVQKWTGWSMTHCTTDFSSGKLKCKKVLECELTALPECQKCKKVTTWSSNFGMDQYVSWGYPNMNWILTQFGRGLKISVSHNPKRCMPSSIFWWVFIKEIKALKNGTSKSHKISSGNCESITLRHFLVLLMWWRFCI